MAQNNFNYHAPEAILGFMNQLPDKKRASPVLLASRRPIFDRRQRVWAYELRLNSPSGAPSSWVETLRSEGETGDGDPAGGLLHSLTGNKRALVRMSIGEILLGIAELLPKEWLIWPQADLSDPNPRLNHALKMIKESGRGIAIPKKLFLAKQDLADLADVVVEKYQALPMAATESGQDLPDLPRLALDVESPDDFILAKDQGFKYFQGRFYAKPRVEVPQKPLPGFRLNQLRLLQEIQGPELRFSRIEEIISNDVSLAYNLLRYINSPFFSFRVTVNSIKQALTLLGQEEVAKWISVVVLTKAAEGKPHELVVLSLVRALFFSEAGKLAGFEHRCDDLFLAGLFSLLDAFFDRPLALIMEEIPLDKDIVASLLGSRTPLSGVVDMALAYEANEWAEVNQAAIELNLDQHQLLKCYHRAVTGARDFFSEEAG